MSDKPQWYVVHTYSGYENKVKANIEKIIENRGMQDQMYEVVVPMVEEEAVTPKGTKKIVQRKTYPGYVLIHMFMNDDTWYVVRNTRGVTSFVGPASKPVALTELEVANMGIEIKHDDIDLNVGDTVRVTSGLFENSVTKVLEINPKKRSVTVNILFSGRETKTELDILSVEKLY